MGWTTEGSSLSPGRIKNFLFFTSSRPALGSIQSPIQWVPGALSVEANWPGHDADNSPPVNANLKKYGFMHPPAPHKLVQLVKHRDKFSLELSKIVILEQAC
jgi:hypothetical protein